MKYTVEWFTSRGKRWIKLGTAATLEEAIDIATEKWRESIDYNAHVSVRIARIENKPGERG